MFGHKSFLRIGALSDSSISGLYKDSYELENCNFSFSQGVDGNGKPQTEVRGGRFFPWALIPRRNNKSYLRWFTSARFTPLDVRFDQV